MGRLNPLGLASGRNPPLRTNPVGPVGLRPTAEVDGRDTDGRATVGLLNAAPPAVRPTERPVDSPRRTIGVLERTDDLLLIDAGRAVDERENEGPRATTPLRVTVYALVARETPDVPDRLSVLGAPGARTIGLAVRTVRLILLGDDGETDGEGRRAITPLRVTVYALVGRETVDPVDRFTMLGVREVRAIGLAVRTVDLLLRGTAESRCTEDCLTAVVRVGVERVGAR